MELSQNFAELRRPLRLSVPSLMERWEARMREASEAESHPAVSANWDSLPLFLEELADALAEISAAPRRAAERHGAERAADGCSSLEGVLREYSVLRDVVIDFLEEKEMISREARKILLAFFDEAARAAAGAFSRRSRAQYDREHHKFRQVFNLAPAIMALWRGPELIFEQVNPAYQAITKGRALLGKPLLEAMPEMKDQPFFAIIRRVFETGEPFVAREMPARLGEGADGLEHYFNFTFVQVLDEAGRPYGVFNHAVDVTDHVRARLAVEGSELALKHTQEQLHLALESAKMGTWSIDLRTNYVTTSPTFARIFGVSDVRGDIFAEINRYMHPEDRAEVNRVWTLAVEKDTLYEHEYRIVWPDGSVRWVLSRGTVKKAPDGTPEYFSGVLTDTTERKEAELKLARAVTISRIGFFDWDIPHDRFNFSGKFRELWGVESGVDLAALTARVVEEDRVRVRARLEKTVAGGGEFHETFRLISHDGGACWVESRGEVQADERGRPLRLFGTTVDVTERVREREYRANQERWLEAVLNELPTPVVMVEPGTGRLVFGNEAARAMNGGRLDEDLLDGGERGYRLTALDGRPLAPDEIPAVRAARGEHLVGEEVRWITRAGEFDLLINSAHLPAMYGHPAVVVCPFQNITKIKATERALQTSLQGLEREREIRERFVSALTHDLRTPMTSARMTAQLLARKNPGHDSVNQAAARIVASMDRADQMIRDLLDANRLKAGEPVPVTLEPFCLNELLHDVVSELQHVHNEPIELALRTPERVCGTWDRQAVRRIVENLVGNAVKYGHAHQPISVSLTTGNQTVTLRVHNFGPAISPEDQRSLFQPFRRTPSAIAGTQRGWGIGLSLVKGLAEAQGGVVDVDSAPERGTTFCVELPWVEK